MHHTFSYCFCLLLRILVLVNQISNSELWTWMILKLTGIIFKCSENWFKWIRVTIRCASVLAHTSSFCGTTWSGWMRRRKTHSCRHWIILSHSTAVLLILYAASQISMFNYIWKWNVLYVLMYLWFILYYKAKIFRLYCHVVK